MYIGRMIIEAIGMAENRDGAAIEELGSDWIIVFEILVQ